MKRKTKNVDFGLHVILTLRNRKKMWPERKVELYIELLDKVRHFRKIGNKTFGCKWEYYAIPAIEKREDSNGWKIHVHMLITGLDRTHIPAIKKAWRKTGGGFSEIKVISHEKYRMNAINYVAEKKHRIKLPKRKRDYAASKCFFKPHEGLHPNHIKALKRTVKAFHDLLTPGMTVSLELADIGKQAGYKDFKRRLGGSQGYIEELVSLGFIEREEDPAGNRSFLYRLRPESDHTDELKRILESMKEKV